MISPKCGSEALYRYGRSHNGKRRLLCPSCNSQFVLGSRRRETMDRPPCSTCGAKLHVNKYEKNIIRFDARVTLRADHS